MYPMSSLLPQMDKIKTERKVREALDLARDFIRMGFHPDLETSTVVNYSATPRSVTNKFFSTTESTAVQNVDIEQRRREHVRGVLVAVERLGKKERDIIMMRWFDDDDRTDIETYTELCLAHATYYRIRSRAFYKLAVSLKLEVYTNGRAE
ncbi:ArpU family phage packaging/lysis transcriptional regulator [Brevibacillus dissolubilis]|uniref:ArpU family phage packaging/lysis transcriptional regulator n=1 Tax=Brevibacillus dissolubilis TaxID=1844116 RepID=UPI0011169E3C|nr:ArpU family phage packaging/lysis transcriptional regulator [Brevibacillus dissolubilis]